MSYSPLSSDLPVHKAGEELLFLREEHIRFMQDMLFFVWHENHVLARALLKKYGLGHAHHRLLRFISHRPGIAVGELRVLLGITKQSLARVLRDVIQYGYVENRSSFMDRRKRSLYLTPQGEKLENELFQLQRTQFIRAFREAGDNQSIKGFQHILHGMLSEETKQLLEGQITQNSSKER